MNSILAKKVLDKSKVIKFCDVEMEDMLMKEVFIYNTRRISDVAYYKMPINHGELNYACKYNLNGKMAFRWIEVRFFKY